MSLHAWAAGSAGFWGGALLALGLLAPFAAAFALAAAGVGSWSLDAALGIGEAEDEGAGYGEPDGATPGG